MNESGRRLILATHTNNRTPTTQQDSKAMDEAAREAAYAALVAAEAQGVRWAVQVVDHARIDEINILQVRCVCGS